MFWIDVVIFEHYELSLATFLEAGRFLGVCSGPVMELLGTPNRKPSHSDTNRIFHLSNSIWVFCFAGINHDSSLAGEDRSWNLMWKLDRNLILVRTGLMRHVV